MTGSEPTVLDPIPRETVLEVIAQFRVLLALKTQQHATMAKLIRGCLDAFEQTTDQAQRRLERERRHLPSHKQRVHMHEPGRKVREDIALAKLHLQWLATQLENESGALDPAIDLGHEPLRIEAR